MKRRGSDLQVRNEIYRRVFDVQWAKANRPTFWTQANKRLAATTAASIGIAAVVGVLALELNRQRSLAEEQGKALAESLEKETVARGLAERARKEAERAQAAEAQAAQQAMRAEQRATSEAAVARLQRAAAQASANEAKHHALAPRAGELASAATAALSQGLTDRALLLSRYGLEAVPDSALTRRAAWLSLAHLARGSTLRGHTILPSGFRVPLRGPGMTVEVADRSWRSNERPEC